MELRLYTFVNYYLSSMQQGIQTGHLAVDLVRKYAKLEGQTTPAKVEMVKEWADNHKTFIVLNGGNADGIKSAAITAGESGYPYAAFHEDFRSLDGMMTCAGVVVPDHIFNARVMSERGEPVVYGVQYDGPLASPAAVIAGPDYNLITLLKSCRLAS